VVKQAPVIKPALAPAAKPEVKQAAVVKHAPAAKPAVVPAVKQAPVVKQAPEPRPAVAPAVETPKAAEALMKKKIAGLSNDTAEPEAGLSQDSKEGKEVPAADAATLDMPTAGSNPRDVVINPAGVPLPVNPYALPAMPGLQRAVARSFGHHGHQGRHVGLRHPDHKRGHGDA
jgi:hypothetical protein